MWHVYILRCADGSLYTGVATDLKRRVEEHNSSSIGAKYTSGRRPVCLVYSAKFKNRSDAQKEESRIKKLRKIEKLKLVK